MFKTIDDIKNESEYLEILFSDPTDIRLKKSIFGFYLKNNPEIFYQELKKRLLNKNLPIKKFRKIKDLEDRLKYYCKNLVLKEKKQNSYRPALTNIYYNAKERHIVGTDAHILLIDSRNTIPYNHEDNPNLMVYLDQLNNIKLVPESEADYKYPDYQQIFPLHDNNDPTFLFHNYNIDKLFYIIKCGKILDLKTMPIKIRNSYFDAFLMGKILEIFKTTFQNNDFVLHVPGPNKAGYFYSDDQKSKGLVMPIYFQGDVNYIEFFNP